MRSDPVGRRLSSVKTAPTSPYSVGHVRTDSRYFGSPGAFAPAALASGDFAELASD